jgi:hypothetical protein
MKNLLSSEVPLSDQILTSLLSLPFKLGGFGLSSPTLVQPLAFSACSEFCKYFVSALDGNPGEVPKSQGERVAVMMKQIATEFEESLPAKTRLLYFENKSPLSYHYLLQKPTSRELTLSDGEMTIGLFLRTLHSPSIRPCSQCGSNFVPGHDTVCIKNRAVWTFRHNQLRDFFHDMFKSTRHIVSKEPLVSPPGAEQRFADLVISGPAFPGGQRVYVDFSLVSVNRTGSSDRNKSVNEFLQDRYIEKINKYRQLRLSGFVPVVFTVGGVPHSEADKLIRSLVSSGVSTFDVLTRLSTLFLRIRSNYLGSFLF